MSYQKIEGTFWTDPKIQQLSPQEKLLFVYLITNSHVHYSGIYYLPKSVIAEETGLPNHTISNGLESLMDGMLIRCDDPKKIIWVINMARYQVTQGNKVNLIKGFASQFNKLHKSTLIKEFLIHYQSLVDGILNPSEWDTEPMPESVAVAVAVTVTIKDSCASFERFWEAYPKKKSKGDAEKAFKAIKPSEQLLETMISKIEKAKTSADWQKEGGKFIPYPAKWLRAKGWEDVISSATGEDRWSWMEGGKDGK